MFENISRHLTEKSIQSQVIAKDDAELYQYAFQALAVHLLSWATICALGILCRCLPQTLVLMALFLPLRIFAGGYHAGSYLTCYFVSTGVFAAVILLCKSLWEILPPTGCVLLFAAGAIAVFLLAPIADPNKPLDEKETRRCKKVTRGVLVVQTLLLLLALALSAGRYLMFMAAAPVLSGVLLTMSRIKSVRK